MGEKLEILDLKQMSVEELRAMSACDLFSWMRDNLNKIDADIYTKRSLLPFMRFFGSYNTEHEYVEGINDPITVGELLDFCRDERGLFVPAMFTDRNKKVFLKVDNRMDQMLEGRCRSLNKIFGGLGLMEYESDFRFVESREQKQKNVEPRGFISIGKIYSIKIHFLDLLNRALSEIGLKRDISSRSLTMDEFKAVFDKDGYFDEEKLREALGRAIDNLVKNFRSALLKKGYIDEDGKWRF